MTSSAAGCPKLAQCSLHVLILQRAAPHANLLCTARQSLRAMPGAAQSALHKHRQIGLTLKCPPDCAGTAATQKRAASAGSIAAALSLGSCRKQEQDGGGMSGGVCGAGMLGEHCARWQRAWLAWLPAMCLDLSMCMCHLTSTDVTLVFSMPNSTPAAMSAGTSCVSKVSLLV